MLSYGFTVLLSSFLLFQVQLVIGKQILPWFGGTPAVWNTCLLFFQTMLLLGYGYVHVLLENRSLRRQARTHVLLLLVSIAVMAFLAVRWRSPILPDSAWKPRGAGHPVGAILLLLTASVGLPLFTLSTTSPLLQAWYSRMAKGRSPYRLYAVSNLGSLSALGSYPFLVEPALTVGRQAELWALAYITFAAGCGWCARQALKAPRNDHPADTDAEKVELAHTESRPTWLVSSLWFSLAGCAVLMMLATTNQLCQEVAVIPLLWIVPLALYIVSFILCFESTGWYSRKLYLIILALATVLTVVVLMEGRRLDIRSQLGVYSFTLFVGCMVCHGELASLRPAPHHLTSFYLTIAAGGAAAGVFVALLAPLAFDTYWEYPLGLVLCWALLLLMVARDTRSTQRRYRRRAYGSVLLLLGLIFFLLTTAFRAQFVHTSRRVLHASRNFYGTLRVEQGDAVVPGERLHALVHGRIVHGYQFQTETKRRLPVSYYGPQSGIGLALLKHPKRTGRDPDRALRIGVIGLGVGTIAAYGRLGDSIRFYEINPEVIDLAKGQGGYFSYLKDSRATVEVVDGDARITLEREREESGSQQFDVLAVDAFNSDAIPVHLLTKEAMELYLHHLRRPDGILVFNITNDYVNLLPVLLNQAEFFRLAVARVASTATDRQYWSSDWVLLTRIAEADTTPSIPRPPPATPSLWTDNYSNVFGALR